MKILVRLITVFLFISAISACSIFRATGETVEATGEGAERAVVGVGHGAGEAVSETAHGAGDIVTGTGRAVVGASDEADGELRR